MISYHTWCKKQKHFFLCEVCTEANVQAFIIETGCIAVGVLAED